jgi:hypothetical protein
MSDSFCKPKPSYPDWDDSWNDKFCKLNDSPDLTIDWKDLGLLIDFANTFPKLSEINKGLKKNKIPDPFKLKWNLEFQKNHLSSNYPSIFNSIGQVLNGAQMAKSSHPKSYD